MYGIKFARKRLGQLGHFYSHHPKPCFLDYFKDRTRISCRHGIWLYHCECPVSCHFFIGWYQIEIWLQK